MYKQWFYNFLRVIITLSLLTSCAVTDWGLGNTQGAKNAQEMLVQDFINNNFSQLRVEMAIGNGEQLTRLAELLEIKQVDKQRFYAFTKNNFNKLFVSPETTAEQLLINLRREMLNAAF